MSTPYPAHIDAPQHCEFCEHGEAEDYCDDCLKWTCDECADQREEPAGKSYSRAIIKWVCRSCTEDRRHRV